MPLFNGNSSGSSNSSITYISSGTAIAPTITYNTGLGTVTIGDGIYRLFHTTNYTGIITEHNISGNTFLITEHITTYICSDYNNGNPILRTITDSSQFNWSNIIPIYTVTRDGDNLSFVSWDSPGNGLPNKIHDRLIRTDRFSRESGLDIGESAIRKIIVSSGIIWQGVYRNSMDSVDSSIDICKFWHTDALSEWIDESITQYDNTQYDTGIGLATLTDGNYAVNWIFRMIGNTKEIAVFLGDGDFDLNTAKASQLPSNIPATISSNGMLIGRIIVLKGADIATQIDSSFVTKFAASTVTSHSGLTDLNGGGNGLYYHSDQPINKDSDVEFNSISISDDLSVGTTASITGDTTIGGDLDVTGNSDLNGTLGVIGNTTIGGTLDITGTTTLNSTEIVNGVATFNENIKQATTKEHRFYNSGGTVYTSIDSPLVDGNDFPDFRVRTQAGTFYVDKNGKFGNTQNPTKELHVVGDAVITGDLDVQGEISYVNVSNLNVEDKNVYLLNTDVPTDTLADGGGIILNGTTDKTILWNQSTGNWEVNTGLTIDNKIQSVAGKSLILDGTSTSIDMKVAGTTKTTLTDTGLGIGTATPSEALDVVGDIKNTMDLHVGQDILLNRTVSPAIVTSTQDLRIVTRTEQGESVRITNTGNVGIGESSPSHKLEVKGNSTYGIAQIIGDGANAESSIGFKDSTDTNDGIWVVGKNLGLSNTSDRFGIFYLNGEKLVITTDGKVGIGIDTPNASSILDLTSTTRGFLVPRMIQAQRLALTGVEGLEVFDTDNHGKYCFSNNRWCQISGLAQFVGYKTVDSAVTTNMDIQFVTEVNYNMGTITSPSIPLKANKTYKIHAYTQIDGDGTTAGARFAFVNASDNSVISDLKHGVSYTSTFAGHTGPQPVTGGIFRPLVDVAIKLRVISISGSPKLMFESFRLEIMQID